MTERPAKFLAKASINGKDVSFFTPPHDEIDFIWVDIEELAAAFLPEEDAKRMVKHAQNFFPGQRTVATVRNGDRIATIASHAMAQGFCSFVDLLNGHEVEEDECMNGPACTAYCITAADVEGEHGNLSFDDIFKAFHNQGGPYLRGLGDGPSETKK